MLQQEFDPGPVPEPDGGLTDEEYANLHNTVDVTHFIFTQMLQDLAASGGVGSMYEPFRPLIRSTLTAAVSYYRDHAEPELAERAQALLDWGKLDSPSVARAPSAAEVTGIIIDMVPERELFPDETQKLRADVQRIVADAMDCAWKQAICAPQTHGSMFARPGQGD